jgi:hypothetical protein
MRVRDELLGGSMAGASPLGRPAYRTLATRALDQLVETFDNSGSTSRLFGET